MCSPFAFGLSRSPRADLVFGDSGSFKNEPCLARNGLIHHPVAERTYAPTVYDEYLACFGDLLFAWGQDRIDDWDLRRMDCTFAVKSQTLGCFGFPFEAFYIGNIEIR